MHQPPVKGHRLGGLRSLTLHAGSSACEAAKPQAGLGYPHPPKAQVHLDAPLTSNAEEQVTIQTHDSIGCLVKYHLTRCAKKVISLTPHALRLSRKQVPKDTETFGAART